jgi:hypothetical protein
MKSIVHIHLNVLYRMAFQSAFHRKKIEVLLHLKIFNNHLGKDFAKIFGFSFRINSLANPYVCSVLNSLSIGVRTNSLSLICVALFQT